MFTYVLWLKVLHIKLTFFKAVEVFFISLGFKEEKKKVKCIGGAFKTI